MKKTMLIFLLLVIANCKSNADFVIDFSNQNVEYVYKLIATTDGNNVCTEQRRISFEPIGTGKSICFDEFSSRSEDTIMIHIQKNGDLLCKKSTFTDENLDTYFYYNDSQLDGHVATLLSVGYELRKVASRDTTGDEFKLNYVVTDSTKSYSIWRKNQGLIYDRVVGKMDGKTMIQQIILEKVKIDKRWYKVDVDTTQWSK